MNADTAMNTGELSLDEITYLLNALTPLERAIVAAFLDLLTLLDEGKRKGEGA